MGVQDIDGTVPNPVLPPRFARWAWPAFIWGQAIIGVGWFIARAAFPYKNGQNVAIEAELKQRRELAEREKQALEKELETV